MKLIEPEHPFYRPLWRRIAVVAVCVLWALFEVFIGHNAFFLVITAALAAYTAWTLLIAWKEPSP